MDEMKIFTMVKFQAALNRLMGLGLSTPAANIGPGGGVKKSFAFFGHYDHRTTDNQRSQSPNQPAFDIRQTPPTHYNPAPHPNHQQLRHREPPNNSNELTRLMVLSGEIKEDYMNNQRRDHKYHRFVEDLLILKSGLIDKKKGLFARRRMFLLTEGPRLFYVDPANMDLKGEVPFSSEMRTEAKNFRTFFVHTVLIHTPTLST